MKNIIKQYSLLSIVFFVTVILAVEPAFAGGGGVGRVTTFLESIVNLLRGISIAVVTIAIIWAGYKFLFRNADIMEVGKIVIAGLLIGGAAEIAGYLLGG